MTVKLDKPIVKSSAGSRSPKKPNRDVYAFVTISLILLVLTIVASFFVIIGAGQRGVLLEFGKVQDQVLGEGLHVIIPLVNTVEKMSVRVQNQEISAEASSKDLQDVFTDVALNWHILPEQAHLIFQQIGNTSAIITRIINPAVEEVLKAVMAQYTAEEIITRRGDVKAGVDLALTQRLATYHIAVDDLSLVHVHFSQRFSEAVEAKQIAEQEAKRAEFVALKATKEAEAKVNLARGEAEAQRLVQQTLTPDLLQKQAIERWNGNLPLMIGREGTTALFDLSQFVQPGQVTASPSPTPTPQSTR
ncbi:prohibitin family protein [Pantanalinema sp. GBBB05]|uniref:prohibitin family protein n=1 Tax=Pantanalinema sp. GBBB05 TaxID=2604139 RepID=UPI001D7471D2|nr:prohibitin family protein [Pantanalinema sp. GBBB05]